MWLFFVTQYNSSLSSFVPNFRILTQVVAEKSLTKKKFTDRQTNKQTDKHDYRKGKNYIPPIQEVFHVYLNKFENAVTHLFLVILGNN